MRKLFIQFYLLLIASFLIIVVLIASVYGRVVNQVGDRYLSDLLTTSLSLIKTELKGLPPEQWQQALSTTDHSLSFPVQIRPLAEYNLAAADIAALRSGDIVMLEDRYLFLQSLPDPRFVLVAGPLRYLMFLHQMRWVDYALLLLIGLSLAVPVFLWMYPHWRDLSALERAARRLGSGRLDERVSLPPGSGILRLGRTFNLMAERISRLLADKKALTDALAHELRTPLARVRYRLALLEGDAPGHGDVHAAIARDLSAIDALIEEMLLTARLDSAQAPLQCEWIDCAAWLDAHLAQARLLSPRLNWRRANDGILPARCYADPHLMGRALDNLLANAARHAASQVKVTLAANGQHYRLQVDDDGEGVTHAERERVFEPFVRLDESRDRKTGGYGLGLAIVGGVARAHGGVATIDDSPAGGARIQICWPQPD